jgi:hypothetical protein
MTLCALWMLDGEAMGRAENSTSAGIFQAPSIWIGIMI